MSEALQVLDRYGVSVGVLMAVLFFLWRVSQWLGPRIDRLADSHVVFVSRVGDQVEKQTTCLLTLAQNQLEHGEKLEEIHKKIIKGQA